MSMQVQEIQQRLTERLGPAAITGGNAEALDPWIEVAAEHLPAVCLLLRDERDLRFNLLHCITGVDYLETGKAVRDVGVSARDSHAKGLPR